ncbi:MAG: T9SS type A sorting domain-containing protein [Bacteroidales bacterium]
MEFYNDGQWNPHYKIENSYNENGVLIQSTKYRTDGGQIWIPIRKMEYSLDNEENIIQSLYYNWDEEDNKWYQGWMEEYTCNENGNITQNIQCEWSGGQKAYFGKYEYTYDNSYIFSELLIPFFDDEMSIIEALDINVLFKHKLESYIAYYKESEQSDWVPYFNGNFYYSEPNVSAINEIDEEKTKIYPNPFSEYISISIPGNYNDIDFELYDLQGRTVLTMKLMPNEEINLTNLNQGIYLYKLSASEGKIQEGKLVKK